MKKNPSTPSFTEDDVRAYAFHLYEQSGGVCGRDLDNWLEAKACLTANIPPHQTHTRLHAHLNNGNRGKFAAKSKMLPEAVKPSAYAV